jgi:hypothetical protein
LFVLLLLLLLLSWLAVVVIMAGCCRPCWLHQCLDTLAGQDVVDVESLPEVDKREVLVGALGECVALMWLCGGDDVSRTPRASALGRKPMGRSGACGAPGWWVTFAALVLG